MAIRYRYKCPKCALVQDTNGIANCTSCGTPIGGQTDGCIQIYRMGSPIAIAVGYGIYIDDRPFGHLANKQSIRIPLPAGQHKLHITCGATRRCQDAVFEIKPGSKVLLCFKAHIKMDAWSNTVVIESATLAEMPLE